MSRALVYLLLALEAICVGVIIYGVVTASGAISAGELCWPLL